MFCLLGFPHVNVFATRLSAKLLTFVSPVPDPRALAVDALSLLGQGLCQAVSIQCPASPCGSSLASTALVPRIFLNCPLTIPNSSLGQRLLR